MKASTWDGKTKYKVNETEEEEKERLAKWDKFLTEEVEKESDGSDKESGDSKVNATEEIDVDARESLNY